jgi:hypothetical protein
MALACMEIATRAARGGGGGGGGGARAQQRNKPQNTPERGALHFRGF